MKRTDPEGFKYCWCCKQVLPKEQFNKHKGKWDGLATECRTCNRKRSRKWAEQHPEEISAQKQRWAENNRDKTRRSGLDWYHNHVDQARESARITHHAHPETRHVSKLRRRARIYGLPDTYTKQEWQSALVYFQGVCAVCGRPPGLWHKIAADHWIPVNDSEHCPGTVKENMIPLCQGIEGCNNSKADKDPIQWLEWKFGKRKAKTILKRITEYFNTLK